MILVSKKVGILTINDYANYGNRLQNYAVQEILKNLEVEPVTVINLTKISKASLIENRDIPKDNSLNKMYKVFKRKLYNGYHRNKIKQLKDEKVSRFKDFTKKYIDETDYSITSGNVPATVNDEFDYFVTGSDQVWNPYFSHFSEIDFLTFADKGKRIAFSPSIAIDEIPGEIKKDYQKWVNGMDYLSVREESGADIIQELTGRNAELLVDPTMALSKQDWLEISKESKNKPNKKYMCTYFLGETYIENKDEIEEIAKSNGLELVNLGNLYDFQRYTADPSEFIDFIYSSEMFLTDSFHGVIFSILFNKPFIVFNRKGRLPSMGSRIDTILSKFNLEDRKWENITSSSDSFNIDFSSVDEILVEEREKVYKYLEKGLDL